MTIKEMRKSLGDTQTDFSRRYHIPFRTIQNWEAGVNSPPAYVEELLERQIKTDLINRRQFQVPKWSSDKKQLPGNNQYMEPVEWLRAVRQELGSDIVFALDSALMCEGAYLGRTDEWVIWIYGNPKLEKYNGVCVIGDSVSDHEVETRNGLRYTCFNRTLNDSLANESILDMQGITEALSRY
jgi:transcriptional regulator with XRE-family HTH domain